MKLNDQSNLLIDRTFNLIYDAAIQPRGRVKAMNENEKINLSRHELGIIFFVLFATFATYFSIDMYLPSLPSIESSLHVSQALAQYTVSAYLLGMAISVLFFGPLSDKMGRKFFILLGLGLNFMGCIVCFRAHSGDSLLTGRLIQGIGAGASMGAIRAVVSDCFMGKRLAFIAAYFGTLISISPILAPVLGGYLETYFNWRANFVALAVYMLMVFVWACFFLKETNQNRHLHHFHWKYHLQNYRTLLSQPSFLIYTVCGGGAVAVSMAYATSAPFIFQKTLGLSPLVFGWMGIFVGGGNILGKLTVPSLIKRYEMKTTLILGLATILFAGLILGFALWIHSIALVLVLLAVLLSLFGQGLCIANAMALGLSPYRHIGGAANALWTFMQMGLSFLISLVLSGPLFKTNQILGLSSVYVLIGLSLMLPLAYRS